MHDIRTIEGDLAGRELRVAVVAARFNAAVVERLTHGAIETLKRHGVEVHNIALVHVPGAFELPVAVAKLLDADRYDAVIALGAVIRGETPHFEFVAGECARGLSQLALESRTPVAFGVLTTETMEQALARAVEISQSVPRARAADEKETTKGGNKGAEAALCAIEMATLLRRLTD